MGTVDTLVDYMMMAKYEDLPPLVIETVKKHFLDTLAATIAGSTEKSVQKVVKLINDWGGREEATILVYGGKVPAPNAAFLNCLMARARDLDDVHEMGGRHVSASLVPAALAVSEYGKMIKGKVINGKSLILALALGSDLHIRIAMAGGRTALYGGWTSETWASISIAAMGAKMLDFDRTKTFDAMGIAYAQCCGNTESYAEGADTVKLANGISGKAGILAIILADQGLKGAKDILEGKSGLYPLYMRGDYSPEVLMADLGKRFEIINTSLKLYPSAFCHHHAVYGTLQLAKEHKIRPDNVKKITIFTSQHMCDMGGGECKIQPQIVSHAQFSHYYAVASALIRGKEWIESFTEEAIRDPQVLEMCGKIEMIEDQEKSKLSLSIPPEGILIETKDGRRYETLVESIPGEPNNPLSMADLIQKLKNCVPFSAKPIPNENVDKISRMVENLDKLDDVTTIINFMC